MTTDQIHTLCYVWGILALAILGFGGAEALDRFKKGKQ